MLNDEYPFPAKPLHVKEAVSPAGSSAGERKQSAVLVHVTRSGEVESVHRGCIVITDSTGRLLAHAGDPEMRVFWRSAAKLHQALPLLMCGGLERWKFSDAELAVICGSHNGEPAQVQCVRSILDRVGVSPQALHCGAQEPYGHQASRELIRHGEEPSSLHNTCSGNHAGLLALDKLLGGSSREYDALNADAQQRALTMVATFAGLPPSSIFTGIDGCGIPAYRTPLSALAAAFARLVSVPTGWPSDIRQAAARIVAAVTAQPDFVSGIGELDTELMRAFSGAAICKLGAEAVCAVAFKATDRLPDGLGVAIKIEDGLGNRARSVVLAAILEQLELGETSQRAAFSSHVERSVKTRRGETVGEIRPVFQLNVHAL
jgi:L-asparaginase II